MQLARAAEWVSGGCFAGRKVDSDRTAHAHNWGTRAPCPLLTITQQDRAIERESPRHGLWGWLVP